MLCRCLRVGGCLLLVGLAGWGSARGNVRGKGCQPFEAPVIRATLPARDARDILEIDSAGVLILLSGWLWGGMTLMGFSEGASLGWERLSAEKGLHMKGD